MSQIKFTLFHILFLAIVLLFWMVGNLYSVGATNMQNIATISFACSIELILALIIIRYFYKKTSGSQKKISFFTVFLAILAFLQCMGLLIATQIFVERL